MKKFLAVLLFALPIVGISEDLPEIGTPTSGITFTQEINLGQAWLRSLRRQVRTDNNLLLTDYLNNRLAHLNRFVDLDGVPITAVVIDSPDLNAFAVPGGIIGINNGLFKYVNSEDELMSVLAHELGHLYQRHFARIQENNRKLQTIQLSSIIAGILLMQSNADLGTATVFAGAAGAATNNLGYSREMEREADRVGLNIMVDAGYSATAMPAMLENMMRSQTLAGQLPPEYMMTHPITQNRIAETRSFAQSKKAVWTSDSLPFQIQKARIVVRAMAGTLNKLDELERLKGLTETPEQQAANHYAFALVHAQQDDWEKAMAEVESALKFFPSSRELLIAKADILSEMKQFDDALKLCSTLLKRNPDTLTESVLCADVNARAGNNDEAVQLYRHLSRVYPNQPSVWSKLATVEASQGNTFQSYRASNETLWLNGSEMKAIRQLEFALKTNQWKGTERSRIADRLDQMRQEVESLR